MHCFHPGYILMDKIKPPTVVGILVRAGKYIQEEVVSEIGVYGIFIGSATSFSFSFSFSFFLSRMLTVFTTT